ncbi:MAG: hypothetical protein H7Z71_00615 [Moraxellaceae bacterium]|nr:hypothetical protein [Pseudobdellovibrionaceae bacterium]
MHEISHRFKSELSYLAPSNYYSSGFSSVTNAFAVIAERLLFSVASSAIKRRYLI